VRAWIAGASRRGSNPNTEMAPDVGRMKSSIVRIVVLLPAPLGPRKPNTSPAWTENVSSATPRLPP
jgi:hypothetical protein